MMARLLVVDDNGDNRYLLRSLLQGHGHEVVESGNGQEALDLARDNPPDCVVTDLLMPVMDGFTLCREWARDERLARLPIVVFTATYTDPQDERLALGLGAWRFVRKPVEPDALVEVIEEVLRAAGDESVPPPPCGEDEAGRLRLYNERLVRKLENKMLQLEQAKLALERQVAKQESTAAALAESERQTRLMLENLSEGVQRVDPQGQVVFNNPRLEQLLGYEPGELLGRSVFELMDERSQALARAGLAANASGQGTRLDLVLLRKDGAPIDVSMSAVPVRDDKGRLEGFLAVMSDIGERKRFERLLDIRLRLWEHAATHTFQEVLRQTLDEVESVTGSVAGFFHFVEPDERTLTLQAWSTRTVAEFCKVSGGGMSYPVEQAGVWGDCVHQRSPVIHNDYASLPHKKGLPEGHVPVTRELVVPIFRENKIVALLGVGNKPTDYTEDDLELVQFLADVAWSIVENRRTAEQLIEALALFEAAIENTPSVAVQGYEADGTVRHWNAAAAKLFGFSRQEAVGRRIQDLLDEAPETGCFLTIKDVWTMGRASVPQELAVQTKAGGIRWVYSTLFPVFVAGAVVEVFRMDVDVTERKQSDTLIRQQLEEIVSFYDTAPIGLAVLDTDLRFRRINDVLAALNGISAAEHVGKTVGELIPSLEAQARAVTAEILRTGQPQTNIQLTGETASRPGETRTWLESWHPMRGASGEIEAFTVVAEDITEAEQMRALLAQSDRLATVGLLAAGVAHEINNPLAYVLYNLESLIDDLPRVLDALRRSTDMGSKRLGDTQWAELMGAGHEFLSPAALDDLNERLKQAFEGSTRIRDIVRGLGTFSRVQEERLAPTELMHPIEAAISMASNEIKHRARLVKEYGKSESIMASDGKLAQVFLNLLINAAHAIPEGAVEANEIRVRTWQRGGEVFAEVHDTGQGISREHIPHLFEPFFTTKKGGRGTGLGLAISKRIIDGYDGSIEVSSEIGKGTSFVVRLPVGRLEEPRVPVAISEPSPQQPSRGRLLVIDDEPAVCSVLTRMLGPHNDIVEVNSGRQAMELVEKDAGFDVILCDLMMPDVSGIDFHAWLSERNAALATRVVFMTGGVFSPRASEYLSRSANIKIDKPFKAASVRRLIGELVIAARSRK
ncbi:MAG: hypothetical protein AUK47_24940 [Deltaproteobacteria bacterium CG2_30_63_29]|nr:MAG: hypothetical protein AUK47_24940 [Deltaproteobacteria bacterium CG2_30_63_29]